MAFGFVGLADVEVENSQERSRHCSRPRWETLLVLTLGSSTLKSSLTVCRVLCVYFFLPTSTRFRGMRELMFIQILISSSILATAIPKPDNEHRILSKVRKKSEIFNDFIYLII